MGKEIANSMVPLLPSREAARLINRSTDTLKRYRREGIGPKYYRINDRVLYSIHDIEEYLKAHSVEPVAS